MRLQRRAFFGLEGVFLTNYIFFGWALIKAFLLTGWFLKLEGRDQGLSRGFFWSSKSRIIRASSGLESRSMAPSKKMVSMPILQEGVFRFDVSEGARKQAHPSVSFVDGKLRETPLEVEKDAHLGPAFIPQCRVESGVQTTTLKVLLAPEPLPKCVLKPKNTVN